jgi:hypothetical protein
VFAPLIDGRSRCWERRVRERADRDCDQTWLFFQVVVDRRTTGRAKVVRDLVARVSGTNVLRGVALDDNALRREASLFSEDTAGPALACETVAHGDADRFAGGNERKLAATARGCSTIHKRVHMASSFALKRHLATASTHPIRSVPVTCAHREVCCPSSWASPMRIPSGPRM